MSDSRQAVFLSYASQDADAARRIAEALRAAGIEVWFDQNELVGGDAWDAKIRQQIKECALFVPIVSAATQARREGYFRLEWKLAAERTHLMADGLPFLLPVSIDDIPESRAAVPPEFLRVQWTRLPDALISPQFVAGVHRALRLATHADNEAFTPEKPRSERTKPVRDARPQARGPFPARRVIMASALVALVGLGALFVFKPAAPKLDPAKGHSAGVHPAKANAKSIAVLPFAT